MGRWPALFLASAIALDCRQATQISLEITSDEPCANVQGTSITVGRLGEIETRPPTASATTCTNGRIGSLVVVPSGSDEDDVAIKIVAGIGQDPSSCVPPYGPKCIVARRALRFVPHEDLQLPVRMAAACAGVPCGETQTCVEGVCVDATIPDPTLCTSPTACDEHVLAQNLPSPQDAAAPDACASVDTANDPKNCGACGHDCLGGACASGVCQPVLLATSSIASAGTIHLALSATNVFWTEEEGQRVLTCPKSGCGAGPTIVAQSQTGADRIAFFGTDVYWTNDLDTGNHHVQRCAATGCSMMPTTIATTPNGAVGIAIDGTNVYFDDQTGGAVYGCPLAGCATLPAPLATGQAQPTGMAVGGGRLYWASLGGSVVGCALPSCASPLTYASALPKPAFVATDGVNVFFTAEGTAPNHTDGAIYTCPAAGCPGGVPTALATTQRTAAVVVLDGEDVYWTNGGTDNVDDGEVVRCKKTGCGGKPTVLASGLAQPWGIAVDATSIFFVTYRGNTILRLAK